MGMEGKGSGAKERKGGEGRDPKGWLTPHLFTASLCNVGLGNS